MPTVKSSMQGKICMVTGADSGIGKATALALAQMGATVVMVCRDRARGEQARSEITTTSRNTAVDLLQADLSSQQSIRQLVETFQHHYTHLHVLINNAGLAAFPGRRETVDGVEMTFAVNYLAPFLLTRSLSQPPVNPLRSSGPTSPLQEAARSRLLLTPDSSDERHHLLLTTRHSLCAQPTILAYDVLFSDSGIPGIQWLDERDRSQLARLYTGPLLSPHRQAILRFLQNSVSPRSVPEILEATSYDHEAGRKMITRMKMAGEVVSTARGLYTTSNHPSLAHPTGDPLPVPNVPNVPTDPDIPSPSVPNVPSVPNPADTTGEVAHQHKDASQ